MRIISNFRDYYDSASTYGIDKECVYKRKEDKFDLHKHTGQKIHYFEHNNKTINLDNNLIPPRAYRDSQRYECINWYYFLIGFCGNVHPLVRIEETDKISYFYDYELAKSFDKPGGYFGKPFLKEFFNSDLSGLKKIFQELKIPIFLVCNKEKDANQGIYISSDSDFPCIFTNVSLKSYNFATIKDANTAFQDIYMYLAGVLGADANPMVKTEDKYIQKAHGMDSKYSFKKPPGEGQWR